MSDKTSSPLLTPILRWFMLAMILANIAGAMYPMMLPIYLTELGASVGQIGTFFFISYTILFILQIIGGWISDNIGRLRTIALSTCVGIIGLSGMTLASTWQWILVAHAVTMIPYALVNPSFGAFIAENSSEENRGRVYGITDTLYHIMGILGPPLGGFLVGSYGFRVMLLVATAIYTVAAGLRIWMATTMSPSDKKQSGDLSWNSLKVSVKTMLGMLTGGGVITWIFLTDGVRDTAFRMTQELEPLYLEQIGGLSVEQIGLLGSLFSVAMMIVPLISGQIADKNEERVPISIGFLLTAIAMVIFLLSREFFGFAAVWVIYGIGVGLLSPAYQSLISKVVPKENLGVFTGLFRSSIGLISLPAPWIGAQLWERFTPRVPFAITAAVAFLAIFPGWFKFKKREEKIPKSETDP
jgi:DHA1 family tetracycline resistance protein-like MFS transporter